MRLTGKTAIVTGGTFGIGEAIAKRYAAEGATVAVVYHTDDARAAQVIGQIEAAGGTAKAFKADCGNVAEIDRLCTEVSDAFGPVDILVNNAGAFHSYPIDETTEAMWDEQLELNLKGPFFLVKALLPGFKRQGGGKVVNIGSIAGLGGFPNCPAYCASKGGLGNLTKALAVELSKDNINVNMLAPGNVATRLNEFLRVPDQEPYRQRLRDNTPSGRDFLTTDEMTGTAVFLASDDAAAVHGVTVAVDGGWVAW